MSEKKNPFRHVGNKAVQPTDIESLFKNLRSRSPKIQALFSHQADILRDYHSNYLNSKDVSLELPTGSGKTLVGLLIAEYRRSVLHERVLYLCPTRQLVYQVVNHSKEYGISSKAFVGSKRAYDRQETHQYETAAVIAISTYSGLFNTSPGLGDPQTIILDDAHGAETYIASMWSVRIDRELDNSAYNRVVSIFEKDLPPNFVSILHEDDKPKKIPKPEAVPFGSFFHNLTDLRLALDSEAKKSRNPDIAFSWMIVRDGLLACHVYVSWNEVLIRPYIPPTLTHKPFSDANQRIYMSATLGRGGELERISGVPKIDRIPTPKTYLSQGIGRRFFIFPDLVTDYERYRRWIYSTIDSMPHSLVLSPTKNFADQFRKDLLSQSSLKTLVATDIEESLDPFLNVTPSVLILANRYDGLDLPNGICQMLVLNGIPVGTNLQEAFLEERLGLDVLLRERIKTRISQAAGRCTRSDTDYAAIIMAGSSLLRFCEKIENQGIFHPELSAELRFALGQRVKSLSEFDTMLKSFLAKDENWREVEQDIIQMRTDQSTDSSFTGVLSSVVKNEVEFCYAMWASNFGKAVELGRNVADSLTGQKLSAYRALWYYFVATAAFAASNTHPEYFKVVQDQLHRATQACKTVSWFPSILRSMLPSTSFTKVASEMEALSVEGIVDVLTDLGASGPKFQQQLEEVDRLLHSKDPASFDLGLKELGGLLGFDAWNPTSEAEPDCVWMLDAKLALLLEGKSDESPDGPISVADCRQTSGHLNWAKSNTKLKDCETTLAVLVTPRKLVDPKALPHAKNLYALHIGTVWLLFEKGRAMLTTARSSMAAETNQETRERIMQEIVSKELTPESIQSLVLGNPVSHLSHSKDQ